MRLTIKELTSTFDDIYDKNSWTHMSGPGSLAMFNRPLIRFLDSFIVANRVLTICDFGCGDWQYMRHVNLRQVKYIGLDVSDRILATNARTFASEHVCFSKTPDDLDRLPEVDLFLSKDTFVHLPNEYVKTVIAEALKKCRLLLSVGNVADNVSLNVDIAAGGFRQIDLRDPPFCERAVDVFQYGQLRIPDPVYPALVSRIVNKYAWPGRKAVQLILGDRF